MKKLIRGFLIFLLVILAGACILNVMKQPEWIKQAICDHVFDEKEVLREASCEEDGMTLKLCTDCGKTKIVTSPALGHTEKVVLPGRDATCTIAGLTKKLTCSVCNEVLQEQSEIPALGHTMEGDTCTVCGFVDTSNYTEVAAQVGEKMLGNWYRLYCYETDLGATNTDFSGIVFENAGQDFAFGAFPKDSSQAEFGNNFIDMYYYSTMTLLQSQTVKIFNNYDKGYIEVFINEAGEITNINGESIYITEDTTIKQIWKGEGKVFRLVPPCEQHVDEDTDAFCDNCSIFLLENATYEAVEVGDSAVGWFRISIEEAKEKDFEVYCDVVDSDLDEGVYSCTKVKDVYGFEEGETRLTHRILWCAEDSPCVGGYSNASERVSSFVEDGYLYIHIEESFTATISPEDGSSGKVNFKVGVFKSIMDGLERIVLNS